MEDLIFNEILAELKRLNNNISTLKTVNKQSEDNKPMTTYEYLLQKYGPTLTWQEAAAETGNILADNPRQMPGR